MKARFEENLKNKLGLDKYNIIREAKIGIAGAGGLGSNCAVNLVRSGFVNLTIVDFDIVDASNLDRQFYFLDQVGLTKVEALKDNLLRINPGLKLTMVRERITQDNAAKLFADCGIVAECLDKAESKGMLVAELLKLDKFIVSASGLGGIGASDEIKTHIIKKNLIIIGDLKADVSKTPAISPRVNIAAAKQADAILEHLIKS